ncbi:MAG: L,D-transpeptidase family protein [Bacteroidales bacterium]
MRIFKSSRKLEVWIEKKGRFEHFKDYNICDFSGGLGPKKRRGDRKSPEGFYFVRPNQLNPSSDFHLSFNIGYPNTFDRTSGCTGNAIMVHGNCVSIGCYAMTDPAIEEIWTIITSAFENGQDFFRIHIFPFRMEDQILADHEKNRHYDFWQNLKDGYDFFENHGYPPNVTVQNRRYVFN